MFSEQGTRKLTLQRSEAEPIVPVEAQQKSHEAITQTAHTVVKNNRLPIQFHANSVSPTLISCGRQHLFRAGTAKSIFLEVDQFHRM